MEYAGFLLRRERLKRNWSQEGLCRDICTISYLSKIEQGKAVPSEDILCLLMNRMDLDWYPADSQAETLLEAAYDALFSFDDRLTELLTSADRQHLVCSPYGADFLLLEQFTKPSTRVPLDTELESCLSNRQLALQRVLQKRFTDAMHLLPNGFFVCLAGIHFYEQGNLTASLELLNQAYRLSSEEGRPRVMLHCKLYLGNCYSNRHDLIGMESHYQAARRLALALKDDYAMNSIAYNLAATQIEAGEYSKALLYFQALKHPRQMDLHKLAICCEKLGMVQEALAALDQAAAQVPESWMPEGLDSLLLEVVRFRLINPDYRKNPLYGQMLLECFHRCRQELPSGYAIFHLNWVIEWYESNRQYKQALDLLRSFPDAGRNPPLTI